MKLSNLTDYLWRTYSTIDADHKKSLTKLFVARTLLAALDIGSLLLVTLAAGLLTSGFGSFPENLEPFLSLLGIDSNSELEDRVQIVAIVATVAVLLFLARSGLSIILERQILVFASKVEVRQGSKLFSKFVETRKILRLNKNESSELSHIIIIGLRRTYSILLGRGVVALSDALTAVLIYVTVFVVNPLLALVTLFYLIGISGILWFVTQKRLRTASQRLRASQTEVKTNIDDFQAVSTELYLAGMLENQLSDIAEKRIISSDSFAKVSFLQGLTRYVFEFAILFGAFALAGSAYLTGGLAEASNSFIVFSAATARLSPLSLGLLQFANLSSSTLPDAKPILDELTEGKNGEPH